MRAVAPVAAVAAVIAALLGPSAVRAQCTPGDLSAGITQEDCTDGGRHYVAITADLSVLDVDVRVSHRGDAGRTADAWAAEQPGAVVAVQGGPFRFPQYDVTGLTIDDSRTWAARDDARYGVFAFDGRGGAIVVDAEYLVTDEPWMTAAVSGIPILRDGAPVGGCLAGGCTLAPRTAIGLSEDARRLVIVAVEGWTARSNGVTDEELANLLRDRGVHDAIRIGEGATSAMWTASGFVVPSSDGAPRPAAAFLALVDRGSAGTGQIRAVVKRGDDPMDPLPGATVRIETSDGTIVRDMVAISADTAYFELSLPPREYIVRASHPGYRQGCKVCSVPPGMHVWCSIFLREPEGDPEVCTPSPRGVMMGDWAIGEPPREDAGVGPDGGVAPPPGGSGVCSVGERPGAGTGAGAGAGTFMVLWVAAVVGRRRR